ncbi:DoxX-like family protein [Sphingobium sp. AP50]|uniref:DoxX family protein n=1 Tax=Sphingobium sp. AP50 TaxID=1884369 RepID=UPI0008BBA8D2|nr:DoxX family protein [Sphingobium sp. AP50]SEJ16522.1 DoxX-like family protein [Sphingobium sp. AP50]
MRSDNRLRQTATTIVLILASCLLALFFTFVGYMKAFAPLAELAQHHAWTVHLPEPAGRGVGWSEMGCALLLLIGTIRPVAGRIGSIVLLFNQMVAAAVHAWTDETRSLPQNAVIILICLLILLLQSRRRIIGTDRMETTGTAH